MGNRKIVYVRTIFVLFAFAFMLGSVLAVEPSGGNIVQINTSIAPADVAGSNNALAGNVTEINIQGYTRTQSWQGYFGNISGTIQLADSSDNVMYNWTLASPQGEVYASTNQSINWLYIMCFNYTAAGTYASDTAQAGSTSLYGTNMTLLEGEFGILWDDVDGVNETFIAGTHTQFFTANKQFSAGECESAYIFDSTRKSTAPNFQEILMYEPTTASVIFTSLLEEDMLGFDQRNHDFEMLVLENGHGTDIGVTPYYFFVEIQ